MPASRCRDSRRLLSPRRTHLGAPNGSERSPVVRSPRWRRPRRLGREARSSRSSWAGVRSRGGSSGALSLRCWRSVERPRPRSPRSCQEGRHRGRWHHTGTRSGMAPSLRGSLRLAHQVPRRDWHSYTPRRQEGSSQRASRRVGRSGSTPPVVCSQDASGAHPSSCQGHHLSCVGGSTLVLR